MDYEILKQKLIDHLVTTPEYIVPISDLNQKIKIHSFGYDQYISVDEEIIPYLVCPLCKTDSLIRQTTTISMEYLPDYIKQFKCQKCGLRLNISVKQ